MPRSRQDPPRSGAGSPTEGIRGGPTEPPAIVPKRSKTKKNYPKRRTNLNENHQNNFHLSDPSLRNRLPSCPACGTRGPVRHIIGPRSQHCVNKALHGAEQGALQRGGPTDPPAMVRKQLKTTKKRSKASNKHIKTSSKQLPHL